VSLVQVIKNSLEFKYVACPITAGVLNLFVDMYPNRKYEYGANPSKKC
jgi:hypothetical protein